MLNIKHIRIDERLIHGQVAAGWSRTLDIDQIIIVDDKAKEDPVQRAMADLGAPSGVVVNIFGVDQFIKIIKSNPIKKPTMLLFTNIIYAKKVYETGLIDLDYINAGNMTPKDGRKKVSATIHVSPEENDAFNYFRDNGVKVIIQKIPTATVERYIDPYK